MGIEKRKYNMKFLIAIFALCVSAQEYECYKCKTEDKLDSCWEDWLLNSTAIDTEMCDKGCAHYTKIGDKRGESYNEIERGCIKTFNGQIESGKCEITWDQDGEQLEECYDECFESFCNSAGAITFASILAIVLFAIY